MRAMRRAELMMIVAAERLLLGPFSTVLSLAGPCGCQIQALGAVDS